MKANTSLISLLFTILFLSTSNSNAQDEFITKWTTPIDNQEITFPLYFSSGTLTIDWGDGTVESNLGEAPTHTYTTAGTYTVTVLDGHIDRIRFTFAGSSNGFIVDVMQWGTNAWTSMEGAFSGCTNLDVSAPDAPNLSNVTRTPLMFFDCSSLVGTLAFNTWDTSTIKDTFSMFERCDLFNQDLDTWDVSNVTEMRNMFSEAFIFNGNISTWNVSSAVLMSNMFYRARAFNQPLNNWNVSSVTNMRAMFQRTENFNQPINNWNLSNVTNINYMFFQAQAFNQPLDNWDVSNVTNMASMFESCQTFDQNIGNWDISSVVSVSNFDGLNNMFRSAGISRVNYDNTLIGWNTLDTAAGETQIPAGIQFHGGNSNYCLSETARQNLIDTSNWIITDGDLSCPIGDVIVPNVVSLSQTDAATTLTNEGLLTGILTGVYSDTIPAGTVISQDPIAGTSVVFGSSVNLVVSLGTITPENYFTTTWKTDNSGTSDDNSIEIPTTGNGYNYFVDWGDGTILGYSGNATHTYASPGTYTVSITGNFPRIYFDNGGDKNKILTIEQWGNIQWSSMEAAFHGCSNLNITNPAIDTPDLSMVTSMEDIFYDCASFNGDVTNWNVSNVEIFDEAFGYCDIFNQPIGGWNMSSATSLYYMFYEAYDFNQPLNNWNVSSVTNMEGVFSDAEIFNQDLNSWNVSSVISMDELFYAAEAFNGNISSWNVSNVENMEEMFDSAYAFDQDISNWNVSNVENMEDMFDGALVFNQDISNWNVGNVTDMSNMFSGADAFNQDISGWDVSSVTTMADMFRGADVFDQNLGSWDIGNIVDTGSSSSGLRNMFGSGPSGIRLSLANYDNTLIGWNTDDSGDPNDGFDDIPKDIIFGGGKSNYCNSELERQDLIDTYGWSISDNGKDCPLQFQVKVYLQGASTNPNPGEESLMRDDLRVANLVPTISPYDGLMCDVTVFDTTGPNAVVDWVFVELRDAINSDIVIEGKSALLLRNGSIVDIDGISPLSFFQTFGDYHVAITHRNHLGVMTAATVSLSDAAITLDLSSDSNVATGGTLALTDMGNGIFAIYAGDVDADGSILNTDISNAISNSGDINIYSGADTDMDGNILNTDIALIIQLNAGQVQQF
ncbi:MAG: BspA family leucine-rich repeat surface protein [Dokdonia sp.]|uniref:BspA family leucine-rich repeat surface protein n=1 Tax=Dokdonia sp. TaxID=2024995 RepID=UPI003267B047